MGLRTDVTNHWTLNTFTSQVSEENPMLKTKTAVGQSKLREKKGLAFVISNNKFYQGAIKEAWLLTVIHMQMIWIKYFLHEL